LKFFSEAIRAIPDNNLQQFLSKCDSDELLQWAFSIVFTRSHRYSTHGEISADVVPVADIFNHRNPGDILWNDTPDYVEFVLKADVEINSGESRDLFMSYGLAHNPHRFLTIFGFVDESIPEVLSQVLFKTPTAEMIALGCNDPTKMVFRSEDGMIANAVWDSMLYALLVSESGEQMALYNAHVQGDKEAKAAIHSRYALEVSLALKKHVEQALAESYSEVQDDPLVDDTDHPRLHLIRQHNSFLREIFLKVKCRLDGMIHAELRRRMSQ